jgi:hypothetical protein
MINTKLQNIIDTKSAIGNAIVNKGGTITSETPFYEYAPAIENIPTGGGAYSTFVAQAQDNSKYLVHNGYDEIRNPTPNLSNNFTFNRWFLNNDATGDVILSNVITSQVTTVPFLDNTVGINEAYMPPIANSSIGYGATAFTLALNNGFVYQGGTSIFHIKKFNESNLSFVENSASYLGLIYSLVTNNGFIYAGGGLIAGVNRGISKYHESNLILVGNTVNYGGTIVSIAVNNGFIYAGGTTTNTVQKFNESTLAFVGNTVSYNSTINSITINNGFIYVGGGGTQNTIKKFHESNLSFVENSVSYGGTINSLKTNNGFIYAGGTTNLTVQKFHESNLAFVGNTANYGGIIYSIATNNGFIYAGGATNQRVQKFYESNLAFVGNTEIYGGGTINAITLNNGTIFATGGFSINIIRSFTEQSNNLVETPILQITEIKE